MSLTTKVLLRKDRKKADGTYPLAIRVIYNRKSNYIPLGLTLHAKDFDVKKQIVKKSFGEKNVTRLNHFISQRRGKIYEIVSLYETEEKSISFQIIKNYVLGDKTEKVDVLAFIQALIDDLVKAKKFGNAEVHRQLQKKLIAFAKKDYLPFEDVNYTFLKKWETEHYSQENSAGGLSVYLRTLRAVYNKAIKQGIVPEANYPFKDFTIKKGVPDRKVLSYEELQILKNAAFPKKSAFNRYRNFFMASYYLRGMNWMDMAYLQVKNISGDFERISYVRSKTKNKRFSIKIHGLLKEMILENLGNNYDENDFLFPILSKKDDPTKYYFTIKNKRKRLNKYLKTIAKELEIAPFTIYTARHTYAMMLKRKGAPTNVIQDSLGHRTEEMTQTYLESFEDNVIDDYDALIMD